jgi:hypothetical protein
MEEHMEHMAQELDDKERLERMAARSQKQAIKGPPGACPQTGGPLPPAAQEDQGDEMSQPPSAQEDPQDASSITGYTGLTQEDPHSSDGDDEESILGWYDLLANRIRTDGTRCAVSCGHLDDATRVWCKRRCASLLGHGETHSGPHHCGKSPQDHHKRAQRMIDLSIEASSDEPEWTTQEAADPTDAQLQLLHPHADGAQEAQAHSFSAFITQEQEKEKEKGKRLQEEEAQARKHQKAMGKGKGEDTSAAPTGPGAKMSDE